MGRKWWVSYVTSIHNFLLNLKTSSRLAHSHPHPQDCPVSSVFSLHHSTKMLHTRLRPLRLPRAADLPSSSSSSGATPNCGSEDVDEDFDEDPEDLFASFIQIPHLFPDDVPHIHGDPGQQLIYSSPLYGDLRIMVPSYPGQSEDKSKETIGVSPVDGATARLEEERKLHAHFLWSAGMVVAEGIEYADSQSKSGDGDLEMWKVRGEKVLELGAGLFFPPLSPFLKFLIRHLRKKLDLGTY